jgi:hypothetical protein
VSERRAEVAAHTMQDLKEVRERAEFRPCSARAMVDWGYALAADVKWLLDLLERGGMTERQGAGLLTRGSEQSDAGSIPAPSASAPGYWRVLSSEARGEGNESPAGADLNLPWRAEHTPHGPSTIYDTVDVGWIVRVKESLPHKAEIADFIVASCNGAAAPLVERQALVRRIALLEEEIRVREQSQIPMIPRGAQEKMDALEIRGDQWKDTALATEARVAALEEALREIAVGLENEHQPEPFLTIARDALRQNAALGLATSSAYAEAFGEGNEPEPGAAAQALRRIADRCEDAADIARAALRETEGEEASDD